MRALHAFAARAERYDGWRSLSTPFSASPRSHPAASRPQRSQFTGLLPYLIICAQFSPPMALLNFPPFVRGGKGGSRGAGFQPARGLMNTLGGPAPQSAAECLVRVLLA